MRGIGSRKKSFQSFCNINKFLMLPVVVKGTFQANN